MDLFSRPDLLRDVTDTPTPPEPPRKKSTPDARLWSNGCTTLDHIYPVASKGEPCYCGKRHWGIVPERKKTDGTERTETTG